MRSSGKFVSRSKQIRDMDTMLNMLGTRQALKFEKVLNEFWEKSLDSSGYNSSMFGFKEKLVTLISESLRKAIDAASTRQLVIYRRSGLFRDAMLFDAKQHVDIVKEFYVGTKVDQTVSHIINTTVKEIQLFRAKDVKNLYKLDDSGYNDPAPEVIPEDPKEFYEKRNSFRSEVIAFGSVHTGLNYGSTQITLAATKGGSRIISEDKGEIELHKTWISRRDTKVRKTHAQHTGADGQTVPVSEPFIVAGVPMRHPGDTTAPMSLWINCRCWMQDSWRKVD